MSSNGSLSYTSFTRSSDRSLIPLVVTTLQEALFELLLQGLSSVADSGLDQQVDLGNRCHGHELGDFWDRPPFVSMGRADAAFVPRRASEPSDKRADARLSPDTACFPSQVSGSAREEKSLLLPSLSKQASIKKVSFVSWA